MTPDAPGPERSTLVWSGPFSRWHPAPFVLDGAAYPTAEHAMMASKARLFGDADALAAILAAPVEASPEKRGPGHRPPRRPPGRARPRALAGAARTGSARR